MEKTKEQRIKAEAKKLRAFFGSLPDGKRKIAESLIQNAAFMRATLDDLQEQVNEEGAVIETHSGNGFPIMQEHPAQKSYNTMIQRYTAVMKQISDMMPEKAGAESKLQSFLNDE